MRTSAPPLLAVFRSQLQGELLAHVLLRDERDTLTDLASRLGAPLSTVQREVSRLEDAGILRTIRSGRGRLVAPDEDNPATPPLRELVALSFGPRQIVAEEFARVPRIAGLYLFGSWAARFEGVSGKSPGDVDVLVVGNPARDEVFDAAERAQRRIGRPVNTTVVSEHRWQHADDPFLDEVRRRPLVALASAEAAA